MKKNEQSLGDWETIEQSNMYTMGITGRGEREDQKNYFKK